MRIAPILVAFLALVAAPSLEASDHPVPGTQLVLSRSKSGKEKLVFQAVDPALAAPAVNGPDDPTIVGATLEVFSAAEDATGTLHVPAAAAANPAQWKITRVNDFTFTNPAAPAAPSTVRVLRMQHGKKLRVVANQVPLALTGPSNAVVVRLTMGTARWCARFDGSSIRRDEANAFKAKGASAQSLADCSNWSLGLPPILPAATQACPTLANGTQTILGRPVQVWIGPDTGARPGPMVFVWHQAGGTPVDMVNYLLPNGQVQQILDAGGIVAAFYGDGSYLGFSPSFLPAVDELVACAQQQFGIDPRRIYTLGFSAGAIQATVMAAMRSSYVASIVSYSGGPGSPVQDPSNRYAALVAYGGPSDFFIVAFDQWALAYYGSLVAGGHYALLCNHDGGHSWPGGLTSGPGLQFLLDHPYGTRVSPYASGGLPAGFPSYCVGSS